MKNPSRKLFALIDKVEQYCADNGLDGDRRADRELVVMAPVIKPGQSYVVCHNFRQLSPFHLVYEAISTAVVPAERLDPVQAKLADRDELEPETLLLTPDGHPMCLRAVETSDDDLTPRKVDDLYVGTMVLLDDFV